MPKAPVIIDAHGQAQITTEPEATNPYQKIAADLRGAITAGILRPGDPLPTIAELVDRYHVGIGTAHRAIVELKNAGLATASRGRRAVVAEATTQTTNADVISLARRSR